MAGSYPRSGKHVRISPEAVTAAALHHAGLSWFDGHTVDSVVDTSEPGNGTQSYQVEVTADEAGIRVLVLLSVSEDDSCIHYRINDI